VERNPPATKVGGRADESREGEVPPEPILRSKVWAAVERRPPAIHSVALRGSSRLGQREWSPQGRGIVPIDAWKLRERAESRKKARRDILAAL